MKELARNRDFTDLIIELNTEQLSEGMGEDGASLPRYVDDPYFKSKESALRYQKWKEGISPNKQKSPEVMDFFITGVFYSTIRTFLNRDFDFEITSISDILASVQEKTGDRALGLSEEKIEILAEKAREILNPLVKSIILGERKAA